MSGGGDVEVPVTYEDEWLNRRERQIRQQQHRRNKNDFESEDEVDLVEGKEDTVVRIDDVSELDVAFTSSNDEGATGPSGGRVGGGHSGSFGWDETGREEETKANIGDDDADDAHREFDEEVDKVYDQAHEDDADDEYDSDEDDGGGELSGVSYLRENKPPF